MNTWWAVTSAPYTHARNRAVGISEMSINFYFLLKLPMDIIYIGGQQQQQYNTNNIVWPHANYEPITTHIALRRVHPLIIDI